MKLIHLSDLHLGKRVNEYSMLQDQKYILSEIIDIIDDQKPDGVIIAGDIYDKSIAPVEAVELFDDFLFSLSKRNLQVFAISGNHDSAERVACGGRLMESSGVHISPVYNGKSEPIECEDEYGKINFYLLPFIKPVNVRRFYPDKEIESYTDAMRVCVDDMNIDVSQRNVLVTHQFVTGAALSDSEDIMVGGTDNIDGTVFSAFDYVALGHIHRPQNVGSERIRYCGTPLKYSFSEANHEKSVTVLDFKEKGNLEISTIPLKPLHDLAEIKGNYLEITSKSFYENTTYNEDYMHITLTDEEDIPDAIGKLRTIYHNLMKIDYDNKRTRTNALLTVQEDVKAKSPLELFSEFYETRNNQPMTDEQGKYIEEIIEKIWEED